MLWAETDSMDMPLVLWWLAAALGSGVLVVLGGHLAALGMVPMESRRRRLRATSTVLMMLSVPVGVYAFGVATPARPRPYVFVWMLIVALMMVVLLLAVLDVMHSVRLHRRQMRQLRMEARRLSGSERVP